MIWGRTAAAVLVVICLVDAEIFAGSFQVIGADYQLYPRALSSDGSTLVGTGLILPLGTSKQGMTWTASGGLSYMPSPGFGQYSFPTAVSADGSVVVGSVGDGTDPGSAFRWTAAQGYQLITTASTDSVAYAVSDDGNTIAGLSGTGAGQDGFVWTAAGGSVALPAVSNIPLLSGDGSTVAAEYRSGAAFTWTAAGSVQSINALPGSLNVTPTVISNDGSCVYGVATQGNSSNAWFIFRYADRTMTALPTPSFYDPSTAGLNLVGVTADGSEMAGTQIGFDPSTGNPSETSWVWTQSGGFISIQDLLAADGIDPGTFQIGQIDGISPDGTELYGSGLEDGMQPAAWIAEVPEPSALAAMAATFWVLSIRPIRFCRRRDGF